ncbi:MAG: hypothetical protein ABIS68_12060 [Casimicrobiaceae bacterium]
MTRFTQSLFAGLLSAALCSTSLAADWQPFAGAWTITGSAIAPWAAPTHPARSAESKRLAGKRVTFTAARVVGPRPIGCAKPQYEAKVVGPDMIFEGMLAEPRDGSSGGASAAASSAGALGFDDPEHIMTLDAGCTEIQFHALHRGAMVFALNNRVYTMVRKK